MEGNSRREQPFYPRERARAFLEEGGKQLAESHIAIPDEPGPIRVAVRSVVESRAHLQIDRKRDGDISIEVGIFDRRRGVVFCRWDRRPHPYLVYCDETGEPIEGAHKHYEAYNVLGAQRICARGEKHIPTSTAETAVMAFCEEVGIVPPTSVRGNIIQRRFE